MLRVGHRGGIALTSRSARSSQKAITIRRDNQMSTANDDSSRPGGAAGDNLAAASGHRRPLGWPSALQPAGPGPGFDPSVAHPARVYAYWLGGKDHFLADRQAAEEVIRRRPQVVAGARANRAATITAQAATTLDFTAPAAVLLLAVLHFIPDTDDPAAIVANLASVLAPGSFVVISHLTADIAPSQVNAGVAAYSTWVPAGLTARTHTQVSALFGGLPLVPPGVVPVSEWRPALASHPHRQLDLYAGVARTPGARM